MTINNKAVKEVMTNLYNCGDDFESYNELWKAFQVLRNMGLIDTKVTDYLVKVDHELFMSEGKEG